MDQSLTRRSTASNSPRSDDAFIYTQQLLEIDQSPLRRSTVSQHSYNGDAYILKPQQQLVEAEVLQCRLIKSQHSRGDEDNINLQHANSQSIDYLMDLYILQQQVVDKDKLSTPHHSLAIGKSLHVAQFPPQILIENQITVPVMAALVRKLFMMGANARSLGQMMGGDFLSTPQYLLSVMGENNFPTAIEDAPQEQLQIRQQILDAQQQIMELQRKNELLEIELLEIEVENDIIPLAWNMAYININKENYEIILRDIGVVGTYSGEMSVLNELLNIFNNNSV